MHFKSDGKSSLPLFKCIVMWTAHWAAMEKYMTLTIAEFRKLMSLYQNDSLTEENLIFQNAVVPIDALI